MTREKFIDIYSQIAELQKKAVLNGTHWFDMVLRHHEDGELGCHIRIFHTDNDDDYAWFDLYESMDEVAAFRIVNNLKAFVCL